MIKLPSMELLVYLYRDLRLSLLYCILNPSFNIISFVAQDYPMWTGFIPSQGIPGIPKTGWDGKRTGYEGMGPVKGWDRNEPELGRCGIEIDGIPRDSLGIHEIPLNCQTAVYLSRCVCQVGGPFGHQNVLDGKISPSWI